MDGFGSQPTFILGGFGLSSRGVSLLWEFRKKGTANHSCKLSPNLILRMAPQICSNTLAFQLQPVGFHGLGLKMANDTSAKWNIRLKKKTPKL